MWVEIGVIKKLVEANRKRHREMVRDAEVAERYYRKKNDILKKGARGRSRDDNPIRSADNRIPANFYNILVNQKASYLFTDPPVFDAGGESANKAVQAALGDGFSKVCKDLCIRASNCTIAWLHYWKDEEGAFKYAAVDSKQVIPIWTDDLEKELAGVLRVYDQIGGDGKKRNIYEYWDKECCRPFCKRSREALDALTPHDLDGLAADLPDGDSGSLAHGFGEVPFIPFPNNAEGGNDLNDVKELIDAYDHVYSGFLNDLEDIQEVVFILSGYEGEDLGEFLQKLKKYKTVKVDSDEEGKGGLGTLTIDIPVEAREKMLAMTRKSIFEQGMGIDPDPQNFGDSSGVALSYLYSLLELKAGLMETEFRPAFGRLVRAICRHAGIAVGTIIQTWTRTSVRNDAELADIAQKSIGVVSRKTVLSNHPWVADAEKELAQIAEEEQEALEKAEQYGGAFGNVGKGSGEDGDGIGNDEGGKVLGGEVRTA